MNIIEIRNTLTRLGWTQKALAEKLCIHPVTLGLILTGKNKLTRQLAAHISLLFSQVQEQEEKQECLPSREDYIALTILHRIIREHLSAEPTPLCPEQLAEIDNLAAAFVQLVRALNAEMMQKQTDNLSQ